MFTDFVKIFVKVLFASWIILLQLDAANDELEEQKEELLKKIADMKNEVH